MVSDTNYGSSHPYLFEREVPLAARAEARERAQAHGCIALVHGEALAKLGGKQ